MRGKLGRSKQRPYHGCALEFWFAVIYFAGDEAGCSMARALVTYLAKRWARVKMRSDWRRRMASLGISSPPMPSAVAPARMKFAAVCWFTPPTCYQREIRERGFQSADVSVAAHLGAGKNFYEIGAGFPGAGYFGGGEGAGHGDYVGTQGEFDNF